MTILADVNVLIYAFRVDSPEHDEYAPWLNSARSDNEPLALSDAVLTGFIRIVTNPRIMATPTPTADAVDFVNRLVDTPGARWLQHNAIVWRTFAGLASNDRGIRGNLVPDAYLAALCLSHRARLATRDRGFGRFPELSWFDPARAEARSHGVGRDRTPRSQGS